MGWGLLCGLARAQPQGLTPLVHTAEGPVQGVLREGVQVFSAIPYAAPPVGPLRFRPPQPVRPWTQTLLADKPIPDCVQFGNGEGRGKSDPGTEDCLYLTVWRPNSPPATGRGAHPRKLPVMVWLYGGGLTVGGPERYDASPLVRHGVVVVTLNFRTGIFGLMADRSLDLPGELSGNYTQRDTQAALRWVQRNIAVFGGDPGNVTLFGQSSGARMAMLQMFSPPSAGLYARVIGESIGGLDWFSGRSGGAVLGDRTRLEQVASAPVIEKVGCAQAVDIGACLRAAPVDAFLHTGYSDAFPFVEDPELFPLQPSEALVSGRFQHVPLLTGTSLNDGAMAVLHEEQAEGHPLLASEVGRVGGKLFDARTGGRTGTLLSGYLASRYGTPDAMLTAAQTDVWQACPADFVERAVAAVAPVYAYELTEQHPAQPWPSPAVTQLPNTPRHGSELVYLFGDQGGKPLAGEDAELADTLQRDWTNFAKDGSPDPTGKVWPVFTAAHPVVELLQATPATSTDFALRHNCAFLQQGGFTR